MKEVDFDSWGSYVPFGDTDVKSLIPKEENNPNLIKLTKGEFSIFEGSERDEWFDRISEEDYNENVFIRFVKDEAKNDIIVFRCPKDEDIYLITKSDKKILVYNYQNGGYYFDDNKLTFTGWDDNIIVNTDTLELKQKYVR